MRVAVLNDAGEIQVQEASPPRCGPDDVLLKTKVAGLCGSDLYKVRNRTVAPGTVLGHEIVAVVEKRPDSLVKAFPLGSRVTVSNHIPCGVCEYCRRGSISQCRQFLSTRFDPGGFAEYIRAPEIHLHGGLMRIPDSVSDEEAVLIEPMGCCLRAVERWNPSPGEPVLVIGLGLIGILMAVLLKQRSVSFAGTDPVAERRDFAVKKGAEGVFTPDAIPEDLRFQGIILTVCNAATLEAALNAVLPGGWIGLFAGPHGDVTAPFRFHALYKNEIDLIPSYSTGPEHMKKSLELLEKRAVDVSGLITHRMPIEDIGRAVAMANDREGMKTMLTFSPSERGESHE